MSTSKYANLPDIDTAPDIYETPDVPLEFSRDRDSDSDNEAVGLPSGGQGPGVHDANIDSKKLNTVEARKKFSGKVVDGDDVDFSSSLVPSRRRKHRSQYPPGPILPDTDEYSILPRGYSIPGPSRLDGEDNAAHETPLMRLRRLRYEMEELEAQIEQEKEKSEALDERRGQEGNEDGQEGDAEKEGDESLTGVNGTSKAKGKGKGKKRVEPSPAQLLVQLQSLRGDLTRLSTNADGLNDLANDPSLKEALKRQDRDARARLDKLKHFNGASVEGVDDGPQAATTKPRVESEGERTPGRLDERLSALEKFLGANEADVDEAHPLPPPLVPTLTKLEHQLHLLTQPRHLDTISRRVKVLVSDLERVHEARTKLGDTRPINIALSSGITVATPGTGQASTPSGASPIPPANSGPQPIRGGTGSQSATETLPPDALQKIDSLFSLLPRLEPLIPLTPHLLNRLRSLSSLHSSASSFQSSLQEASREVERLKEGEGTLKEVLDGVGKSLEGNEETVRKNLEGLEARVADVVRRLEALEQ